LIIIKWDEFSFLHKNKHRNYIGNIIEPSLIVTLQRDYIVEFFKGTPAINNYNINYTLDSSTLQTTSFEDTDDRRGSRVYCVGSKKTLGKSQELVFGRVPDFSHHTAVVVVVLSSKC